MNSMGFIKKLARSLYQSVNRFPVTIFFTTAVTVCLIIQTELMRPETISKLAFVCGLGIPLSLIVKFLLERVEKPSFALKLSLYSIALLFLLTYSLLLIPEYHVMRSFDIEYSYFEMVPITRYIAVNIALYLIAVSVPFAFGRKNIELYVITLIKQFAISLTLAIVLALGLMVTLVTIETLLGAGLYGNIYLHLWIIIMGIFAPVYFLSGIPQNTERLSLSEYSLVLKILLLYIIMPLILVYTGVLYIYFAKILLTFKWPEGIIGNLVLWYSALTTFVIFLIFPLKEENRWVESFSRWLPLFLIPLILLMFVSMGIRLRAYGITENRYFVLALGVWILAAVAYYLICKGKRNVVLPLLLALVAIFSVSGPWSCYKLSIDSQNQRLEEILKKYDMVQGDQLIQPRSPISYEDERSINELLYYFENSHRLSDIRYLPQHFTLADVEGLFGFKYRSFYNDTYISYYLDNLTPIDTAGFDYMFSLNTPGEGSNSSIANLKVEYSQDIDRLVIYKDGDEVFRTNLLDKIDELKQNADSTMTIPLERMTFAEENSEVRVKLILTHVFVEQQSPRNLKISSLAFYLFVDIK